VLHKAFGDGLKLIHVKRERESCIASLRYQAESDPLAWDGYVGPVRSDKTAVDAPYDPAPPTAVLLGEMDENAWNALSLDDKLGWFYDTSHRLIEEHLHLFPDHLQVATEELDRPATIRRVAQFVNPAWRQACPPVHLNHGLRAGVGDIAEDPHHAAQEALADFDLHQMAASDTYPVVYFLQRMIAEHNSAEKRDALADLEVLRGEINTLVERAEGRVRDQSWQAGSQTPRLRLVADSTLSPEQAGRLEDFFAEFEPDKLEASSAYPVIYFLQRLMALREVTGDGDPELAATYRFMGDQVDALIQKAASGG
jgi:hypothetical protein